VLYCERETIPPNSSTLYFVEVACARINAGKMNEGRAILDELLATLPYDAVWSYNIIDIAIHSSLLFHRPNNWRFNDNGNREIAYNQLACIHGGHQFLL